MAYQYANFDDLFDDGVEVDADGGLWGLGADLDPVVRENLDKKLRQVDATFARAAGLPGVDLRRALSQMEGAIQSAINLYRAKLWDSDAKAARDAAYALEGDLKRQELQSSVPVPDWLLREIRDRVKTFLVAGTTATQSGLLEAAWDVFGPMTPEKVKFIAKTGGKYVDAAGDLSWSLIPTWVKVTGAGVLVLGGLAIFLAIRRATPYARAYVERQTGIRGIGVIHKGKSGRTEVCFRGRRSRRSRRERICFPARDKRQ